MVRVFVFLYMATWSLSAFGAIDRQDCINLFLSALEEKNTEAAEFLVNHLNPLSPQEQSDANIINLLIKENAPYSILYQYLSHENNLRLADASHRTPIQASLYYENEEALAILQELGVNAREMFSPIEMSVTDLKEVIKSLKRLNVDQSLRKIFLTHKWINNTIEIPGETSLLNLQGIVYLALAQRETALIKYIQSRSHEIPNLFSKDKDALQEPGHLALRFIQDGGSENLSYLRLMHSLGLNFTVLNHIVLSTPFILPGSGFSGLRVIHDSVFHLAASGLVAHPLARTPPKNLNPNLTYWLDNPWSRTISDRLPDTEILKFLLNEVKYSPTLKEYHFSFLRSPDLTTLEIVLNHPAFLTYRESGIDFFEKALPTKHPNEYRSSNTFRTTIGHDQESGNPPVNTEIIDREKIDRIIAAGFDPRDSMALKLWASELKNAEADPQELGEKQSILNYLTEKGYTITAAERN